MANSGSTPAAVAFSFNSRLQKPWMVETYARSSLRSRSGLAANSLDSRSRMLAAAFSVNVIASISEGSTPCATSWR